MAIGEAGITFYSAGGHDHDGINSSQIDSTKYAVWDWEWNPITDSVPSRLIRQFQNYQKFETAILNVINQNILSPAGVQLLPNSLHGVSIISETITATQIAANTITANEIQAGTITGDLFNANVVLVNQVIGSNNYAPGVSGWAIYGNGTAEFDAASIRGTITAGAVNIGQDDFWNSDGSFMLGGANGIYTSNGVVRIGTSVVIEGDVLAGSIYINDDNQWNNSGFVLGGANGIYTSGGNVRIGTNVIIEGAVVASAVSTGGVNIYSNGVLAASNFVIAANGAFGNNNFEVDASGNLWANNADITGEINATSGSIGNWTVLNGNLYGASSGGITTLLDPNGNLYASGTIEGTSIVAYNFTIGALYAPNGGFTVGTEGDVRGRGIAYSGPGVAQNSFVAFQNSGSTLYAILNNSTVLTLATTSDIKFKRNIVDLENTYVEKLLKDIRVVQFNSFDEETNEIDMSVKRSGVIAQDVINVFPDIVDDVNKDGSTQYSMTINYSGFVPYLIKTVQYLSDKINDLTARLDVLEQ